MLRTRRGDDFGLCDCDRLGRAGAGDWIAVHDRIGRPVGRRGSRRRACLCGECDRRESVAAYTITPSTGALAATGASVAAGALPIFVTIDPAGTFAYVANGNSDDVSVYSVSRVPVC
jgi:DNA-binding beta-propeller fold protein YncE